MQKKSQKKSFAKIFVTVEKMPLVYGMVLLFSWFSVFLYFWGLQSSIVKRDFPNPYQINTTFERSKKVPNFKKIYLELLIKYILGHAIEWWSLIWSYVWVSAIFVAPIHFAPLFSAISNWVPTQNTVNRGNTWFTRFWSIYDLILDK